MSRQLLRWKNTEKCPVKLERLAVTQTSVEITFYVVIEMKQTIT